MLKATNQTVSVPDAKQLVPKLVTGRVQMLQCCLDVVEGIGCFSDLPYHIQLDQSITLKQTPCRPILMHLKEAFSRNN